MVLTAGYLFWRLLTPLVCILPVNLSYRLASLAGLFAYYLWHEKRECAKSNYKNIVEITKSNYSASNLAKESFRYYGKYLVDFARIQINGHLNVLDHVSCTNWNAIAKAQSREQGTLMIGLHQGNWDIGLAMLTQSRFSVRVLVDDLPTQNMDYVAVNSRKTLGATIQPVSENIRPVIRALKQNEFVAMLIDQPHAMKKVRVFFLDQWISVPSGAAILALKTGASVITGGIIREKNNSFKAIINDPIIPQVTGNQTHDIQHLTQKVMTSLEQLVLQHPEQWFVFRPLWQGNHNEHAA